MRKLLLIVAVLLLPSCIFTYGSRLEDLHGLPLERAVALLGTPTSRDDHHVVWDRVWTEKGGGYYHTTYQNAYTYDKKGKVIARTEVPFREWVPPYETTYWCRTSLGISPEGVIISSAYDGNGCR